MQWFSRARLLVLTLICLFWTGLIFVGHFFPTAPFISTPWRGEQSFEDLLRREGRKTTPPRDFVFLGIDQSTLQLPPLTPKELAGQPRASIHDRATVPVVTRTLGAFA